MAEDVRISLYQQMAELTLPKCSGSCKLPLSCCSPEYCEMTKQIALEEYNTDLKDTGHPTLPLMGENGCTAPPHMRPICSVHVCSINAVGYDRDQEFTEKYFELREKINEAEYEAMKEES